MSKLTRWISLALVILTLTGCGEYYKAQRSTDVMERYEWAKRYYAEGKYTRVITLMEDIISSFTGTTYGPEVTYMMGDSYLKRGYETEAAQYFRTYYTSYPKGEQVEDARYNSGYCLYKASPEPRLEQSATYGAIQELQLYLDHHPEGKYRPEVEQMLFALQDKLAEKELLSAKLYYNLGLYLGNNYQSAVVVAKNALKDFPYTRHREELLYTVLRAKAEEAALSVVERQQDRVREAIDYYYNYANEFPQGQFAKDAKRIHERMQRIMIKDK